MDYLEPLSCAFFSRKQTLAESIREHLRLVLQTPRGSFPADSLFGCDLGVGGPDTTSGWFAEDVCRAILHAEKRVSAADVRVVRRTEAELSLEIVLRLHPPAKGLELTAEVSLNPFQVQVDGEAS